MVKTDKYFWLIFFAGVISFLSTFLFFFVPAPQILFKVISIACFAAFVTGIVPVIKHNESPLKRGLAAIIGLWISAVLFCIAFGGIFDF